MSKAGEDIKCSKTTELLTLEKNTTKILGKNQTTWKIKKIKEVKADYLMS